MITALDILDNFMHTQYPTHLFPVTTLSKQGSYGVFYTKEKTDAEIKYTFEIPGVKPEDLDVNYSNEGISVVAKRNDKIVCNRQFYLEDGYDPETITATHEFGVLTITMSKMPSSLPRKITINTK